MTFVAKSVEFNNAGVHMLAVGRLQDAHDLFRAALLSHLGHQQSSFEGSLTMLNYLMGETGYVSPRSGRPLDEITQASNNSFWISEHQAHERAFCIPEDVVSKDRLFHIATIHVFNLALVHQLQDRTSWKARSFYEIAGIMMAMHVLGSPNGSLSNDDIIHDNDDEEEIRLNMAIVKNLEIWLRENNQSTITGQQQQQQTLSACSTSCP